MIRSFITAASAILLMVMPGLAAQRALIVGNDNYPGQQLMNARKDATAFAEALNGLHWQTTLVLDANQQGFRDAVASFTEQLSPGDTALVYYSGHGMQVDGINYLIPVDFQLSSKNNFLTKVVSLNGLSSDVLARKVRVALFILDACRSNPFLIDSTRAIQQTGWANVSGPTGTFLAFGTAPGSTASDNPNGNHGLFTQAILDNLQKNADADLEAFFRLVRQEVMISSSGLQVPWTASSLTGSLSFADDPMLSGTQRQSVSPKLSINSTSGTRSLDRFSAQESSSELPDYGEGDSVVRELVLRGLVLLKANRVDEAIKSVSSALTVHPHAALVLRILSLIFQLVGRNVESMKEADLAIAAAPGDSRGFAYRGVAEISTDPTGAVRDEQAALGINPATQGAHETLAQALLSLGQTEAALNSAQQAVALFPSSAVAYSVLGKIYQAQGDFEEASRSFRTAVNKAPAGTVESHW